MNVIEHIQIRNGELEFGWPSRNLLFTARLVGGKAARHEAATSGSASALRRSPTRTTAPGTRAAPSPSSTARILTVGRQSAEAALSAGRSRMRTWPATVTPTTSSPRKSSGTSPCTSNLRSRRTATAALACAAATKSRSSTTTAARPTPTATARSTPASCRPKTRASRPMNGRTSTFASSAAR